MKNLYITLGIFSLLTLVACDKTQTIPQEPLKTFEIDASITRSSDEGEDVPIFKSEFENKDQFSFFVWVGERNYENMLANNILYTLNFDAWVAEQKLEYKDETSQHDCRAIYPATSVDYFENLKAIEYPAQTDVLYASGSVTPQTEKLDLKFKHIMALMKVSLEYEGFSELDTKVSQILVTAVDDCKINFLADDVSLMVDPAQNKSSITFELNEDSTASRIMVPQDNIIDMKIVIDEKTYTYSGADINLQSGCSTSCKLKITKHNYKIELGEVSLKPWNKGNDFDFNINEN